MKFAKWFGGGLAAAVFAGAAYFFSRTQQQADRTGGKCECGADLLFLGDGEWICKECSKMYQEDANGGLYLIG